MKTVYLNAEKLSCKELWRSITAIFGIQPNLLTNIKPVVQDSCTYSFTENYMVRSPILWCLYITMIYSKTKRTISYSHTEASNMSVLL